MFPGQSFLLSLGACFEIVVTAGSHRLDAASQSLAISYTRLLGLVRWPGCHSCFYIVDSSHGLYCRSGIN